MIVDLSFVAGHSVNDNISPELCLLFYASVDNAVGHIQRLGCCTQLVKIDLRNAYCMVLIHPHDQSCWQFLGEAEHVNRMSTVPYHLVYGWHQSCSLLCQTRLFGCYTAMGCATSCITSTTSYFLVHLSPTRQQLRSHTFQKLGIPVASNQNRGSSNLCDLPWHPH